MKFDGFLTRAVHAFVLVCVSVCGSVCEWEVFTYSNPGNTHDYMWLECEAQQTGRLPAQTVQRWNRLDVNVRAPLRDVRSPWKHLEGDVLFQGLKAGGERCQNYLVVSVPLSQRHAQLPAQVEEWKVKRTWVGDAVTAVTQAGWHIGCETWVWSFGCLMKNIWTCCVGKCGSLHA